MEKKDALINYSLRIADTSLILGQRLAEWCSKGPSLEEDLALTNVSLDLFGQARILFGYVAELKGGSETEFTYRNNLPPVSNTTGNYGTDIQPFRRHSFGWKA